MADYKGIKGYKVQSRASDPTADEGQIWYNTTSNALKYDAVGAGAWSSGGGLIVGRTTLAAAGASTTSAIAMGGVSPLPPTMLASAETYNGTAWSSAPSMINPRRYFTGLGTETAAVAAGGMTIPPNTPTSKTELFNGVAWAELPTLARTPSTSPQAQTRAAGFGISTSAMLVGGDEGSYTLDLCEQFNGTSWAEVGDLLQPQCLSGGAGQTGAAGLNFGGNTNPPWATTAITNEWNNVAWTSLPSMNTARQAGCGSSYGTVTSALWAGGTGGLALTETYNGTSWTEVATLAVPRYYGYGCGTGTSALAIAGEAINPAKHDTEEWDGAPAVVKTVTVS